MYLDKILWFLAWPGMIVFSYYMTRWALKKLDRQIMEDEIVDTNL
jgi:hypothetical protein